MANPNVSPIEKRHRIVVLCGPNKTHKNTCATLIRAGLNVVGMCVADKRIAGLPLDYIRRSFVRKGVLPTLSRALARIVYKIFNSGKDREISTRVFDEDASEQTLAHWHGPVWRTRSFSNPATLAWLESLEPDIFVAHTADWISRKVRRLARTGFTLGGHPGITPYYRGSHSAFWAIYRGRPEDIGCTVFLLDDGVDTGEIVAQDFVSIEPGDSFITLGWKGVKRIAEMQAAALRNLDMGIDLPRRRAQPPNDSEFDNPRLLEFLRYRRRQRLVR